MKSGWPISTPTSSASKPSSTYFKPPANSTKSGNNAPPSRTQMQLDLNSLPLLLAAEKRLDAGFANLPPFEPQIPGAARMQEILNETATRLQDNYPYFHPLYAGQMLKPPHPVARLAYALAMFINPNNHALDGGRATSALEKEAVAEIAAMFGWQNFLGHLTGGGTMANLEALWVAGQLAPGKKIVASEQAHYTHHRISSVLQLDFESIPVDNHARMDLNALESRLAAKNDVGTVVVTMGTTATGSVDPLPEILKLRDRYNFRVHADAAYGGYFTLAQNLAPQTAAAFAKICDADSIVIDPHKHGLQPYGCGCALFRDPSAGRLYNHDSPSPQTPCALPPFQPRRTPPRRNQPRVFASRRRSRRTLGHSKIIAAQKGWRVRPGPAKGNRHGPRFLQETQSWRQIHPRLRTRTRHPDLRPAPKKRVRLSHRNLRRVPSNLRSSRCQKSPPRPGRTPRRLLPKSPRQHPSRQTHRDHPPLRPHEARARSMARPNPRNPHLGLVAPTSCRRFLSAVTWADPARLAAHMECGASAPLLRRSQPHPSVPLASTPLSPNSHSMHHLSVHNPLTTVHRFLCPKCNHIR